MQKLPFWLGTPPLPQRRRPDRRHKEERTLYRIPSPVSPAQTSTFPSLALSSEVSARSGRRPDISRHLSQKRRAPFFQGKESLRKRKEAETGSETSARSSPRGASRPQQWVCTRHTFLSATSSDFQIHRFAPMIHLKLPCNQSLHQAHRASRKQPFKFTTSKESQSKDTSFYRLSSDKPS